MRISKWGYYFLDENFRSHIPCWRDLPLSLFFPRNKMSIKSGNIETEIQETLVNISNITSKIKWELKIMKGILEKTGNLALMVKEANKKLAEIARNKGISSVTELQNEIINNGEFDASYSLNPFSTDLITEALMSIVDSEKK